jgi:hypothetical protein
LARAWRRAFSGLKRAPSIAADQVRTASQGLKLLCAPVPRRGPGPLDQGKKLHERRDRFAQDEARIQRAAAVETLSRPACTKAELELVDPQASLPHRLGKSGEVLHQLAEPPGRVMQNLGVLEGVVVEVARRADESRELRPRMQGELVVDPARWASSRTKTSFFSPGPFAKALSSMTTTKS